MKLGRKYVQQLQNAGKIKKVIALAAKDAVSCSDCGHGASKHFPRVEGWESWSTLELTKYLAKAVPLGTRQYCPSLRCKLCEVPQGV